MGSNSNILFYCAVALSVVAAATQLPPNESDVISGSNKSDVISEAALVTSDGRTEKTLSPSRRLQTAPGMVLCLINFGKMKGYDEMGKICNKKATMKECCSVFKKLACPNMTLLNREDNTCAKELFDAIQTKAKVEATMIYLQCGGVIC